MKTKTLNKRLLNIMSILLVFAIMFQTFYPISYVAVAADKCDPLTIEPISLKGELSKNGNIVTEYENDEDKKIKTVLWAKGVKPPKMGGKDSQFKKQITYDSNGNVSYIDYIAPYVAGNGWYDVNKSKGFVQSDMNLCFAAAASNSLHWWLDQNSDYIDKYIKNNPDDIQIQKLSDLRESFENQQKSGIYDIFLRQFANKQDGYYPDILQDQFINGYYPKPNGGTNDSPTDRDKLKNNGPDKNGGFFYNVFGTDRLTDRRYYDNGFDAISKELKELFLNGDNVLMTFSVGRKSHVVTLWGVEFDQNGTISAVYYSDSDDEANQGMMRYRVVNSGGKAVVTTQVDGKSNSVIQCLQILSSGKSQWQKYFGEEKKTLDILWKNTELVYNGKVQAPTVVATNIEAGDDITLSVEGGNSNAGQYTATVVLSGPSADKYKLPKNSKHIFVINKAPAPKIIYPSASTLQYGQKLVDSVLIGGSLNYGDFSWDDPQIVPKVNNSGYKVNFKPSNSTIQNYDQIDSITSYVPLLVEKSTPNITIKSDVKQNNNSNIITLSAKLDSVGYGELPSGFVEFIVKDNNENIVFNSSKISIKNGFATATWNNDQNGKFTIRAKYFGNENYNSVLSDINFLETSKLTQSDFKIEDINSKVYGDDAFILKTTGGSGNGKIIFESSDSSIISISNNVATIKKAGKVIVKATKEGDSKYNPAIDYIQILVDKKELKVIADDKLNIVQGSLIPNFTYTVVGLAYDDNFSNPTIISNVEDTNNIGKYEINISGGELTNYESYSVTYINGVLSVVEKQESSTVSPITKPATQLKPSNKPIVSSNNIFIESEENSISSYTKQIDSKNNEATTKNTEKETSTEEITTQLDAYIDNKFKIDEEKEETKDSNETNAIKILLVIFTLAFIIIIFILVYKFYNRKSN